MFNRIKTWWKTSTPLEKVNTVLNIVGIGATVYCAKKIDHAFDRMKTTITIRGDEELMNHIHGTYVRIETDGPCISGPLDPGEKREVKPEELAPNEFGEEES